MRVRPDKLHKKYSTIDLVYLITLAFIALSYLYFFQEMPLSEDAGYYAFLSKEMQYGMVLHNDMPATTNSLLIYINAIIFKIFGHTTGIYRASYLAGYCLLIGTIYALVRKYRSTHEAFLTALLSAVFITIPYIAADLGMNQIIWCLALIFLGLLQKLTNKNEFAFGLLLAIASLTRETFLSILLFYGLLSLLMMTFNHGKNSWKEQRNNLIKFGGGAIIGLSVNIIILEFYHSWVSYFQDMLHSGAKFRYQQGFFSLARIHENLSQLKRCYHQFYSPLILFAGLSYFMPSQNNRLIQWLKFFFLPAFLVESILINRTSNYSIIPVLVTCIILTTYFWAELSKLVISSLQEKQIQSNNRRYLVMAFFTIVVTYTFIAVPKPLQNTYRSFRQFHLALKNEPVAEKNLVTERSLAVIKNLPNTKKISANAMYPLLFLLDSFVDYKFPYMFDLTAPTNLNRKDIELAQLDEISHQGPDILVLKTTGSFSPNNDIFQHAVSTNYILIADFGKAERYTSVDAYKNRIYISQAFFNEHYHLLETPRIAKFTHNINIENPHSSEMIVQISCRSNKPNHNLNLINKWSKIGWDSSYTAPALYSLVQAHSILTIEKINNCPAVAIKTFRRKPTSI